MPARSLSLCLSVVTGDDLAVSFLPREMLVLMLRPPSLTPSLFKGPSLVVSLSTCNNRGGGGCGGEDILDPTDHGTATHAERGVSSGIASSAGRALPLPLPPNAVNSSGFQIRIDSKMAARRYYFMI